jgi:hypothetical protein
VFWLFNQFCPPVDISCPSLGNPWLANGAIEIVAMIEDNLAVTTVQAFSHRGLGTAPADGVNVGFEPVSIHPLHQVVPVKAVEVEEVQL